MARILGSQFHRYISSSVLGQIELRITFAQNAILAVPVGQVDGTQSYGVSDVQFTIDTLTGRISGGKSL